MTFVIPVGLRERSNKFIINFNKKGIIEHYLVSIDTNKR